MSSALKKLHFQISKIKFRNMKLKLNNKLRYSLYAVLYAVFLSSCEDKTNNFPKYRYIVKTTHDNNWTTSAIIRCDSLTMKSQTSAILWVDGREMFITAPIIRIYDNPYFKYRTTVRIYPKEGITKQTTIN